MSVGNRSVIKACGMTRGDGARAKGAVAPVAAGITIALPGNAVCAAASSVAAASACSRDLLSGDVTGVAVALTAQMKDEDLRLRLYHAAVLSSWLTGRAAEVAVFNKGGSPESLTATAVIENLAGAFHDLRAGAY